MQQIKNSIFKKHFIGITAIVWVFGLLIAGSDSPFMPWVNGIGLLLFFGTSVLLGKLLNTGHFNANTVMDRRQYKQPDAGTRMPGKGNRRINIRYAMEI